MFAAIAYAFQRNTALGAQAFEHFASLLNGGLGAGNHGLTGVVEIDSLDHLCTRAHLRGDFGTTVNHLGSIQPQNGCHGPRADGHSFLHGCSAQTHQRRCLRQCQRTGSHQGRILAQRMPGYGCGQGTAFSTPGAPAGHACHQHDGLGVGSERQGFFGAFVNQLADVFAQGVRGFFQSFCHGGVLAPGVEHADCLRTLAGKDECKR